MFKPTSHIPALAVAAVLAIAPAAHANLIDTIVAPTPDGSFHLAWLERVGNAFQVQERALAADGSLGPAQVASWVSQSTVGESIEVDGAGHAVIAWRASDAGMMTVYARRRTADGTLTPVQRISPAGVHTDELQLAVEPDGDAVFAWTRQLSGKYGVQARRRAADGTLGPVLTLSWAGAHSVDPHLDVAPDGAATVAWERLTANGRFVQSRTIAADSTVGEYQRLSASGFTAYDPSVTAGDGGVATIAWLRSGSAPAVQSRTRSAAGELGTTQTISPAGTSPGQLTTAGNGEGRTAYTWLDYADLSRGVMGRIRQPNGSLGPVFYLVTGAATDPRVALDPDGHASFAWLRTEGQNVIQTRRRTASGTLGTARTLSVPGANVQYPTIAAATGGTAAVTWFDNPAGLHVRTITPGGTVSPPITVSGS